MKKHVSFWGFLDSFSDSYKDNFTYEGKKALYDYLIQLEEDLGEELNCDIVAFCCDYNEYENLKEYIDYYKPDIDIKDYDDVEDYRTAVLEHIEYNTTLIPLGDHHGIIDEDLDEGFIIQAY